LGEAWEEEARREHIDVFGLSLNPPRDRGEFRDRPVWRVLEKSQVPKLRIFCWHKKQEMSGAADKKCCRLSPVLRRIVCSFEVAERSWPKPA